VNAKRKSSAFVPHDLPESVRGSGSGPLAGLTVAVKDMYDIAGERTGGGSPDWLAAHGPATRNAAAVERLLASGADIVGKTVCDEFFYSVTGANAHYGTPVNVRAPGRMPGGSSSGSAAATAAGACDIALGSDTGGSVRVPAALCGIYGIRPTHGRVDLTGAMAMAPSFDSAGWFASGPGVLRKVGSVLLEGDSEPATTKRLLVASDAFAAADPDVAAALRDFLDRSSELLPPAVEATIGSRSDEDWRGCFRTIQGYEIWAIYGAWINEHQPRLGPGIRERIAYAATVTARDVAAARADHATIRARIRALLEPGTILCLPTAPCIAPPLDASSESLDRYRSGVMALTCIAGLAGLPQVSLPAAVVAGCPVGFSLVGWAGADETLLQLAVTLGPCCGA
jgi:amidase